MADQARELSDPAGQLQDQISRTMEQLMAPARPGAVFGEPVRSGDFTIITACELGTGGGFGFGGGTAPATAEQGSATAGPTSSPSGGSAAGGGGGANGRPVAVIVIKPTGVEIQPIVDVTKLGIAGITTFVAMLATIRKLFG